MSRIFMIGDSHLGLGYPNRYDDILLVHKEYFKDFLIPLLKKEVKPGDIIIHLGDLFDNRSVIPIDLLNYTQDILYQIAQIAPLHIILGNHDIWSRSYSEINSIGIYKYIPNIHIYEEPTKIQYNGLNLLLMPYIDKRKEQIKIIQENKDCHYLFCHSDLNGSKMHLTSVAHRNTDKIDVEEFSNFKKVFSGHIHIVQKSKNFTFVGNIFEMDRNDRDNQKGIFILDTESGEEIFFENNISPKFKKIYLSKEEDIDRLEDLSNNKDYIDLIISNSLLIDNRKIRRKLEKILLENKFANIDYIDDIIIGNSDISDSSITKIEESLENTIDVKLDYKEYIKEYINVQEFNTQKIKDGVIDTYNSVIRLYSEGYKK